MQVVSVGNGGCYIKVDKYIYLLLETDVYIYEYTISPSNLLKQHHLYMNIALIEDEQPQLIIFVLDHLLYHSMNFEQLTTTVFRARSVCVNAICANLNAPL